MKTLTVLLIAGFIFAFSPAADWLALNTPDWVGALILCIGVPCAIYALMKLLFTVTKELDK